MIWILFFVIAFFVFAIAQGNKNISDFEKTHKFKISDLVSIGTYVSGHPSLDKSFKNSSIVFDKNIVKIFELSPTGNGYILKSSIEKPLIQNVVIEDASTIQNRVTVGRLLLTGVFAFAWKKKEKQECAYLIIEWNLNQFKNETIFEFEGKGSIEKANTLRNKFIKYLSEQNADDNKNLIPKTEIDKYLELISKNRIPEAINLYIFNNKCNKNQAENFINNLINETNLQK